MEENRCGTCAFWMLLDECPREYPIPGGHRGPGMYGMHCEKYERSALYTNEQDNISNTEDE